jgi:hypothetical protein
VTLLDDIVDGSTDDAVTTSNLLRKVQVVATRLGADELKSWVKDELNGYEGIDRLPTYRRAIKINVTGRWAGYFGSQLSLSLGPGQLPEGPAGDLFQVHLTQSIAELEQLANLDDDPSVPWEPSQVAWYDTCAKKGLVSRPADHNLMSARKVVTRGVIRGVIDAARNHALDFALELQSSAPDAGSLNGPTVATEPIRHTVLSITNNIFGDGTQLAVGRGIRQGFTVVVAPGDLEGLLRATREAGLSNEGTVELASAVLAPDSARPRRIKAFLDKIGNGAFAIGTGAAGDVLGSQVGRLVAMYLGGP